MQRDGGYGDDDWRRARWGGSAPGRGDARPLDKLADLALEAGLWASACLAVASLMPAVLVPALLRELLLAAALAACLRGLLRGERLGLEDFNRQDVALALIALALLAGFFVDPAAVEAFMQAEATSAGSG